MRNECVQNLKSISQIVVELWLTKNCLILECNDLKFTSRTTNKFKRSLNLSYLSYYFEIWLTKPTADGKNENHIEMS